MVRPPILLSSVSSSLWPAAFCLQFLDAWLHLMPCVQQYLLKTRAGLDGRGFLYVVCLRPSTSVWREEVSANACESLALISASSLVRVEMVAVRFAMVSLSATVAFAKLLMASTALTVWVG